MFEDEQGRARPLGRVARAVYRVISEVPASPLAPLSGVGVYEEAHTQTAGGGAAHTSLT